MKFAKMKLEIYIDVKLGIATVIVPDADTLLALAEWKLNGGGEFQFKLLQAPAD